MAEYIEREAAKNIIAAVMHKFNCAEDYGCDKISDALFEVWDRFNDSRELPAADVRPERHGR